jgi:hypothetical protein
LRFARRCYTDVFDAGVYQDFVAANVQKQDEGNQLLTLQVLIHSEVVTEQSTTEPDGVATLTLSLEEIYGIVVISLFLEAS